MSWNPFHRYEVSIMGGGWIKIHANMWLLAHRGRWGICVFHQTRVEERDS